MYTVIAVSFIKVIITQKASQSLPQQI